jgi:hypothetical protein
VLIANPTPTNVILRPATRKGPWPRRNPIVELLDAIASATKNRVNAKASTAIATPAGLNRYRIGGVAGIVIVYYREAEFAATTVSGGAGPSEK